MTLSAPRPLDTSHRLEEFDCGKPALTDWLLRHARQAQSSGSARTFVACDEDRVAGYFSLLQDAIRRTVAIAEHAGIRALLTHPIDAEADAFYRRFGFEPTPAHEQQLILLLKDARRFVKV